MAKREFPNLTPSSRTYTPGRVPETVFEAQNGSSVFVQFGGRFVNAEFSMEFRNIQDSNARLILVHYHSVVGDDYVSFSASGALDGIDSNLQGEMEDGNSLLRYRYSKPPSIQSVYPGISTVQCSFTGFLYGA